MNDLRFTVGNAKLDKLTGIFSLPAGYSCPFARECKSMADRYTSRITDGKDTIFRCFAATGECRSPHARKIRWDNFDSLLSLKDNTKLMANYIINSIANAENFVDLVSKFRIHDAGDFFTQNYFDAWLEAVNRFPQITFYAYTKSLPFWINRFHEIPGNLFLTASYGGKLDHLIPEYNLKYAKVVYSVEEAKILNLPIDHDDSNMYAHNNPFALLIHGTQPAGSEASKSLSLLKKQGITGYSRKKRVA